MGASRRHDLSASPPQWLEANAMQNQALVYFILYHESVKWLRYLFIFFCELAWGPHSSGRCWVRGIWEKQAAANMKGARPTSYSIRMKGAHLKSGCLKNATGMFFAFANSQRVEERELLGVLSRGRTVKFEREPSPCFVTWEALSTTVHVSHATQTGVCAELHQKWLATQVRTL